MAFTKKIFNTPLTSDGESSAFTLNGDTRVKITGSIGGGTVEIHSSSGNEPFSTTGSVNDRTAVGEFIILGQQGFSYKLVLTGSTAPNLEGFISI